jgi:hypothetical protein
VPQQLLISVASSIISLGTLAAASAAHAQPSLAAIRFFGTGVGPPGQQDRVRIPIDDNLPPPTANASAPADIGTASFTIEFWLRGTLTDNPTSSWGGAQSRPNFDWILGNTIIDRDIWGSSERDWGISIAGGRVRFGTGRGDTAPQDPENTIEYMRIVLDDTWRHVAVVRDAASGRKHIYIDGTLDYSSPPNVSRADLSYPDQGVANPVTPWGPFVVIAAEKHDAGVEYPSFRGYVDEVRLWSVARTSTQIATDRRRAVPSGPGLVGLYRFEEGSGTTTADSSGSGSPAGQVIAGVPGNAQWVLRSADVFNTAPLIAACSRADLSDIGDTGAGPDAQLTVDDIIAFVNTFSDASGCPAAPPCNRADLADIGDTGTGADGQLTVDDIIAFVNAFSDGCP